MNHKFWTLAVALLAVFSVSALPMSAETTETTIAHFEISSPEAGDAEFDIENPEVGDVEVFWTDSGEKIVVSYDDEGFLVDINGKEIRVPAQMGALHTIPDGASGFIFESDDEHQIVLDGSAGNTQVMIWNSDEDGEDESNQEIHIIKRHDATVEIEQDGGSKVIHIPGGHDLKVMRTKDEEGNVQVKVLRNGEEIDLEELAEGDAQVQVMKMGESDDGMHVIEIRKETEDGSDADGDGTQIQVQIRKTIKEN